MDWLEHYQQIHQHPFNRVLHGIGIPTVVISLPLFFWDWRWALGLFVVGWIFQLLGHVFERRLPAFFSNPIYLIVGPIWWVKKMLLRFKIAS